MRPEIQLDHAIFQLTPTRTRCELYVSAGGITEKLASGLLKPFLAHLRTVEEQVSKGGYSIRLEPSDPNEASWFTKGTMERFVRFVSTPEVLERVSSVEMELLQLEETITTHGSESTRADDLSPQNAAALSSAGGKVVAPTIPEQTAATIKTRQDSIDGVDIGAGENSKKRLLRVLDARRIMLQKEQGMDFARAAAAGFNADNMADLVVFAECFGATRLREACIQFMMLCKKRQEAGLWFEEMDLAAAEAASTRSDMSYAGQTLMGPYAKHRDYPDTWSDTDGGYMKLDEVRDDISLKSQASFYGERRMYNGDYQSGNDTLKRRGSLEDSSGEYWRFRDSLLQAGIQGSNGGGLMSDLNGEHMLPTYARSRHNPASGKDQPTLEELQVAAASGMPSRTLAEEGLPVNGTLKSPQSLASTSISESLQRYPEVIALMEEQLRSREYRDIETGRATGVVRGHPVMPAWQGQPPQFMQNYYPPYGAAYSPSQKPSYAFGGSGRVPHSGIPYNPQYLGSPLFPPAPYSENNNGSPWRLAEANPNLALQDQPQALSPYWPGSQGYRETTQSDSTGAAAPFAQQHEAASAPMLSRDETQELRTAQWSQLQQGVHIPQTVQSPAGKESNFGRDSREFQHSPTPHSSDDHLKTTSDTGNSQSKEEVADQEIMDKDEHSSLESRRLPWRSASPRRRSPSPRRRVQIGRSGPRRSGMVVIRNINYIAPNSQDNTSKDPENDNHSSDSWSQESESALGETEENLQSTAETVRVSVQDVIGLFESKRRDGSDSKKKSSKQDTSKGSVGSVRSSKRTVMRRWNDAGDLTAEDNEEDWNLSKYQSQDPGSEIEDDAKSVFKPLAEQSKDLAGEEKVLLPDRGWRSSKRLTPDMAQFESDTGKHRLVSARHSPVPEEDLLALHGREESGPHPQARALPQHDSEGNTKQVGEGFESSQVTEEVLMLPEREALDDRSTSFAGSVVFAEQQGPVSQIRPTVDDSFVISERGGQGDGSFGWKSQISDEVEVMTSQNGNGFNEQQHLDKASLDDSFIVPARDMAHEQANKPWRTAIDMESEMPVGENLGKELAASNSDMFNGSEPDDLFMMPERNADSAGRCWNTAVDYDMQLLDGAAYNISHEDDQQSVVENMSPKEQAGEFDEQYCKNRGAKVKAEPGSKRTERETKLRTMQEMLEKRRAELGRNPKSQKATPLAEAQLRAEKLRAYKADLQKSKKEKEEEERRRIEELKVQRRERIAARSSTSAIGTQSPSSTPRESRSQMGAPRPSPVSQKSGGSAATTPRSLVQGFTSLSSRGRSTIKSSNAVGTPPSSRRSSISSIQANTVENPLSRSLPSLSDLRRENSSRSSAVRSSTGSQQTSQAKSSGQSGKLKSVKDATTVSTNSLVVERKRQGSTVRKSIGTTLEMKGEVLPDSGKQNKVSKAVGKETKSILRKADGTGPGAVGGTSKQKTVIDEKLSTQSVADEAVLLLPKPEVEGMDAAKVGMEQEAAESIVPDEAGGRAGTGPGLIQIRAPASAGSESVVASELLPDDASGDWQASQNNLEETQNHKLSEDLQQEGSGVNPVLHTMPLSHDSELEESQASDTASNSRLTTDQSGDDAPPALQASGAQEYHAPMVRMSDPAPDGPVTNGNVYLAPFAPPTSPLQLPGIQEPPTCEQYNPPMAPVTESPVASPSTRNLPQLHQLLSQAEDSWIVETVKPRKKWGSSEKSSSAGSDNLPKEAAKGFKRLLKFGRKSSQNTGQNTSDRVSAATTLEGDEHAYETRNIGLKSIDDLERKTPTPSSSKGSDLLVSSNGKSHDTGSVMDTTVSDKGSLNSVISSMPSQSRPVEDHFSGDSSGKASRSFFSLSTFRSKSSEGKSR